MIKDMESANPKEYFDKKSRSFLIGLLPCRQNKLLL